MPPDSSKELAVACHFEIQIFNQPDFYSRRVSCMIMFHVLSGDLISSYVYRVNQLFQHKDTHSYYDANTREITGLCIIKHRLCIKDPTGLASLERKNT